MKPWTIEQLNADDACAEGLAWIAPYIDAGDVEALKVALVNDKPSYAQWAHARGYDVIPSDESKRNGAIIEGGCLVYRQTAGHYSTQRAGDDSTQTAGGYSTQTAEDCSTQTAGGYSTQTAGDDSTQTAGGYSTQRAGDDSTQTAGDGSTQTAGYCSTQTAGYCSTQTAGGYSTQTAGYRSTQTAGHHSTQTAGDRSTQTAGDDSRHRATAAPCVFVCRWWDNGWRMAATVCDGETLKVGVFYTYDTATGEWRESEDQSEPDAERNDMGCTDDGGDE